MICKPAVFFFFLTIANAGYIAASAYSYSYGAPHAVATPAVVNQHSNILCTHGNLGQISTYAKSISTPHTSGYKSDIRVSNDALAYPYSHEYAATPSYSHGYATPAYSHAYAAPSHVASACGHGYAAHTPRGLLGVAFSPATFAAHFSYRNGYGLHYSY